MSVIKKLIANNTYPVVFIGSGISMRYLEGFPDWDGLLQKLWKRAYFDLEEDQYYDFMVEIRERVRRDNPEYTKNEIDYYTNIIASTTIEEKFNAAYISRDLTVDNYDTKKYYQLDISPFKMEISNHFSSLNIKRDNQEEYLLFQKFLTKTKIILTTNYDRLIEKTVNDYSEDKLVDSYIGQTGFLREGTSFSEVYKVHGCVTEPESIVITESDYDKFNKNSILISAKIISSLINSPIIFLGYSLKDINIRKIISDFSLSIDKKDKVALSDRIILVERTKGQKKLIEKTSVERDLGCEITVIETDNYGLLFEEICQIDEGVSSAFISRYQKLLKNLIVERGKEGTLQSLLITPAEMAELEENHELRKNAAVVIGDSTTVFVFPNVIDYFIDYFTDRKLNFEVAIKYIASVTNTTTRVPFHFYSNMINIDQSTLNSRERDKFLKRTRIYSELKPQIDSINKYNKVKCSSIDLIKEKKLKKSREVDQISFNINEFPKEEVKAYILESLHQLKEKNDFLISTELRRLSVLYDIKYVKNTKAP